MASALLGFAACKRQATSKPDLDTRSRAVQLAYDQAVRREDVSYLNMLLTKKEISEEQFDYLLPLTRASGAGTNVVRIVNKLITAKEEAAKKSPEEPKPDSLEFLLSMFNTKESPEVAAGK